MDLRDASHEEAVEAIRKAGNPVCFLVQSIIHRPRVSLEEGHSAPIFSAKTSSSTSASVDDSHPSTLGLHISVGRHSSGVPQRRQRTS